MVKAIKNIHVSKSHTVALGDMFLHYINTGVVLRP